MNIISLLPAATEIVAALGAGDALVAVSHECDYPPFVAELPRVTTSIVDSSLPSGAIDSAVREAVGRGRPLFGIDAGLLVSLAPDVIITQSLCDVCAVSDGDVRSLADILSPPPGIVQLGASTLDGVKKDILAVGAAIGKSSEAEALVLAFDRRLRSIHNALKSARAPRPRLAVVEWLDPLFSAGHWTPEIVRAAGGIDVLAIAGSHSVQIGVATIRAAEPDLLIFAPCGFNASRAFAEARALLTTNEWEWAHGCSAWAIDGNALTSRPGPRLADAVETIAAIVAPGIFPAPPEHYARQLTGVAAAMR